MATDFSQATPVRRLMAALLDGVAAFVLTALLASTAGMYWASRAVVTLRIEDPNSPWKGLGPMLLGLAGPVSYGFSAGLVLVLTGELLFGVSPGKLVTGTAILGADAAKPGMGRLSARFLVKASGPLLFCLALVAGRWEILVLGATAGLTVLVSGLGIWKPGGGPVHDRTSGTSVFRV